MENEIATNCKCTFAAAPQGWCCLSWVWWDSLLIGIKFSTTFCSPITNTVCFGQCGHKLLEAKFSTTLFVQVIYDYGVRKLLHDA